jgi:HAD superfamily hydrolase (TIGR01509 family)
VDSSQDITVAFRYALKQTCPGNLPSLLNIAQHIGKPLAQMAIELGYRLSPSQLARFLDTYRAYYNLHGVRNTRTYPGVVETLHRLTSTTFGVVTTKSPPHAQAALRVLNMACFFRHVQGTTPDLMPKPAPDTVLAALQALQCDPQKTLMVGDTSADIEAGRAAGIRTCAVTYGFGSRQELRSAGPDYWISCFTELTKIIGRKSPNLSSNEWNLPV